MQYKSVVTAFLQADERILLLRRSGKVGTHRGRWSAVSGYLEGDEQPLQRAQTEIQEEVGLGRDQASLLKAGQPLRAFDEQTETVWVVYPFLFEARSTTIRLDWENTEYKWINPNELRSFETVPKLRETFDRVHCNLTSEPNALSRILRSVDELALDRVHGASFLGRQAAELLSLAAEASEATTSEELFCDLLNVAFRLRSAQSGMAVIRNLVGMLLHRVDLGRASQSASDFRSQIRSVAKELMEHSVSSAEDAARNAVALLPTTGYVLTHSYSSVVFRALELGKKSGKGFQVYATESYPGMEGKQLAKDLVGLGVPVKLIADSAVPSIIAGVSQVLVGADSVLADGSLVHKVGTRNIASTAHERGIPLYSVCETTKFSTADLLKEPTRPFEAMFDVTPSGYILKFITEIGSVEPSAVEGVIRLMLRETYP